MLTPEESSFVDIMVGNIVFWRATHAGVMTPTGKPKKMPWFLLVRCTKGHITTTNSKRAMGMRFRCGKHGFRPGKGTIKCESRVEIIEVADMKELLGLSKEEADDIHATWKEKNE